MFNYKDNKSDNVIPLSCIRVEIDLPESDIDVFKRMGERFGIETEQMLLDALYSRIATLRFLESGGRGT